MDDKLMQTIEAIIRRGNDAEIRRKGNGYIVLEARERAIGAEQYADFAWCWALLFSVKTAYADFIQKLAICKPKSAGGTVTATT